MEVNGGPTPGLAEATLYKGYRPTFSPDHLPHTRNSFTRPGLLLYDHFKQLGTLAPCNDQSLYLGSMSPIDFRRGRY
jgi:hypothetical protein